MVRRVLSVVLVMLLCVVYAPAGVARASSSPWVPPSYGSGEDVSAVLDSGAYPNEGYTVGVRVIDAAYPSNTNCAYDRWSGLVLAATYVSWTMQPSAACSVSGAGGKALAAPTKYRCDGGAWMDGVPADVSGPFGTEWRYSYVKMGAGCSQTSRIEFTWDAFSVVGASWTAGRPGMAGDSGLAASIVVTCASATDVQVLADSGMTPSVSCPAGYRPVGATVTRGGTTVGSWSIPDAAEKPALSAACVGGECQPRVTLGGYSCDPTMAVGSDPDWCRRAGNGGSIPADAGCEWSHPTLGVLTLTRADCASWLEGVAGPPVPEPEEHDSGVIVEWLQRILDAINRVKSAVDSARDATVQAVEGVRDAVEGIAGPGGDDGGSGGPGPGAPGAPSAQPGPLTVKFQPWLNVWSSLSSGLQSTGTCQGPPLTVTLGGQAYTLHLLEACDGARAQLAAVSRAGMSVLLVVVMILSTVRVLSSSLGLQLKGGE